MTVTLTRCLDLESSDRSVWTYPAGTPVTVRALSEVRDCVCVDGRVYRCSHAAVERATA